MRKLIKLFHTSANELIIFIEVSDVGDLVIVSFQLTV